MSSKQIAELSLSKVPVNSVADLTSPGIHNDPAQKQVTMANTNAVAGFFIPDNAMLNDNMEHINPTDVSAATTERRSYKRSATQAFGGSLPDDQGISNDSAKVLKMGRIAAKGSDLQTGNSVIKHTAKWLEQVDLDVMGVEGVDNVKDQDMDGIEALKDNKAINASFGLDGTDDTEGQPRGERSDQSTDNNEATTNQGPQAQDLNQGGTEPTAFDAAMASHARTAISILHKYTNPRTSYPLTTSFQNLSTTISGATSFPARITQAEFVGALNDAQNELETLATRKNASIPEMMAEQQELSSIGLAEEAAEIMRAVTNAHRFVSTMRADHYELDLVKHAVRNLDEDEEEDGEMPEL